MPEASTAPPLPDDATVLVTGAGGSVGAELVELLLAAGYRVRATALERTPLPFAAHERLEVIRGDLRNRDFCRGLLGGCTAVVHTAARIDITLPWEELVEINRDAVAWLYEAASEAGTDRFVHLSTASLYAASDDAHYEDDPLEATSPYEQTKLEAEQNLLARTGDGGPAVAVLRPSMIYGPRNKDLAAILPALPPLSRRFLRVGIGLSGGPVTNWVHARDVARAALFLLQRPLADGAVFNVADDTRKPFGAMLDDVYAAYGVAPAVRIPLAPAIRPLVKWLFTSRVVLALLNRLIGGGWRRLCRREGLEPRMRPKVFPDIGAYASNNWIFANDRLDGLGFELVYPEGREGWADTIQWYRGHGWVPREI